MVKLPLRTVNTQKALTYNQHLLIGDGHIHTLYTYNRNRRHLNPSGVLGVVSFQQRVIEG